MIPYIDRKSVEEAVQLLKNSNKYTVTLLAKELEVSRGYLYKHFSDLLKNKEKNGVRERVTNAIKKLRKEKGKIKLDVTEVVKEAGISRQSYYRYCSDFKSYVNGISDFEESIVSREAKLEARCKSLEKELKNIKEIHQKQLKEESESITSILMLNDIDHFSASENRVTVAKLQSQNDDLAQQNKRLIAELSEKNSQLSNSNYGSSFTNPAIKGHFKPDHRQLNANLTTEELMKLFLRAERSNIDRALEASVFAKVDAVILFQPLLSCNFDEVKVILNVESLFIIESNLYLNRVYQKVVNKLKKTPVHSISLINPDIAKIRMFCNRKYGSGIFREDFVDRILNTLIPPSLEDGFVSTSVFQVNRTLVEVKN